MQVVVVGPRLGAQLDIQFISRAINVCSVITVEELVAPPVGVDAETRKPPHRRDGVEVKTYRLDRKGAY